MCSPLTLRPRTLLTPVIAYISSFTFSLLLLLLGQGRCSKISDWLVVQCCIGRWYLCWRIVLLENFKKNYSDTHCLQRSLLIFKFCPEQKKGIICFDSQQASGWNINENRWRNGKWYAIRGEERTCKLRSQTLEHADLAWLVSLCFVLGQIMLHTVYIMTHQNVPLGKC